MKFKIIADSSCNITERSGFAPVPLKVVAGSREYVDNAALDVAAMMGELKTVKGRTGTSCPNVYEWKEAVGDADEAFLFTITGKLSGSHAAAVIAAEELMAEHPEKKIAVFDTLSTGPEMELLIEKTEQLREKGLSFAEREAGVREYMKRTHLLFCLQSLENLAKNGRVNTVVAKVAGVLGIRIVGIASEEGRLELLHKPRGAERALRAALSVMEGHGYKGGAVRIAHCQNQPAALSLKQAVLQKFPHADVTIRPAGALCSFYAEDGGYMVGYET